MSDSSSRLPARPSFEQLQKQAKELLKQHRAGKKAALDRFLVVNMRSADSQPTLASPAADVDGAECCCKRRRVRSPQSLADHRIHLGT
jgi:hypothetical protein